MARGCPWPDCRKGVRKEAYSASWASAHEARYDTNIGLSHVLAQGESCSVRDKRGVGIGFQGAETRSGPKRTGWPESRINGFRVPKPGSQIGFPKVTQLEIDEYTHEKNREEIRSRDENPTVPESNSRPSISRNGIREMDPPKLTNYRPPKSESKTDPVSQIEIRARFHFQKWDEKMVPLSI